MGDACVVQMWMGTHVIAVVKRLRPRWPGRRDGRSRSMGQGGSRREFVNRPRNPNGAVWAGVRAPEVVSYRGFLIILSWYISYVVYYRYPTTTHPSIVGEEWQFIIVSSYSLDFYFLRAVVWPATYRLRVYDLYRRIPIQCNIGDLAGDFDELPLSPRLLKTIQYSDTMYVRLITMMIII